MRDLARALSNIKLFHYDESFVAVCDERNGMLSFPLGLVYEAIDRAIKAEAENECLKRALSDIEDWCVEFHVTGPHDPEKALKIVMTIYDIAHEQLGDRTEEFRVSEEGER